MKVPLPPTPGEEHEQNRKRVLHTLSVYYKKEGLTLDEITRLSGLVELRAARALQELVYMRLVARRGRRYSSVKGVSI